MALYHKHSASTWELVRLPTILNLFEENSQAK